MVASPITGLVRGLNALIAGLAIQLQQIAEQGLVGDGEAAARGGRAHRAGRGRARRCRRRRPAAEADDAAPETEETDAPSEGDDDEQKEG